MGQLKPDQYAAARRMIDEEVIGAYHSHKGKILDGWYDKLASCFLIHSLIDDPTPNEREAIAMKIIREGKAQSDLARLALLKQKASEELKAKVRREARKRCLDEFEALAKGEPEEE